MFPGLWIDMTFGEIIVPGLTPTPSPTKNQPPNSTSVASRKVSTIPCTAFSVALFDTPKADFAALEADHSWKAGD
jgi:hypothetical protein